MASQAPQVRADVDRHEVEVGGEVTLTISVDAPGGESVELWGQPRFAAFRLLGSNQSSVFNIRGGAGVRTTTWEFQLRAVNPGSTTIGPIRLRVGDTEVQTTPLAVAVAEVAEEAVTTLDRRLAAIVDRAPGPDGTDEVIVSTVATPDSIVLGEQLDLVVVAWFPRDVRARLRTRPTLTPPDLRGAWTYSQTSALGVASTREVDGRIYDLFVHHQVVFPLTAGRFEVGSASVSYNLPLRMSILSREVPQEVRSEPVEVLVDPQPIANRPVAFGGAAGADLRLSVTVDSGGFSRGDAGTITATLTGRGNVALWPEPVFRWPEGLRVYPGRTQVAVDDAMTEVGGSKTFRYLVVPDSVGTYAVPAASFVYYDLGRGALRELSAEPLRLVSRVGREISVATEDAALADPLGPAAVDAVIARVPPWGWAAVLLGPPLMVGFVRGIARVRRRARRRGAPAPDPGGLSALEASFRDVLTRLVPDAMVRDGAGLAAALEAAGVETPVAAHAARVRDRLRQAVYGPSGSTDADELAAEVQEVLRALPGGTSRRAEMFAAATVIVALALAGHSSPGAAQTPSAEQWFEAGGYRQAADSFALRAATEPGEPAHWINLGHSWFAAGEAARARAAWVTAARLRPRDRVVKSAVALAPSLDTGSRRLLWVSPVTPAEALVAASGVWILAWMLALLGARIRRLLPLLAMAGLLAGYAAVVERRYGDAVGLTVADGTPLRPAPYGTAPATRSLAEDTAVRVLRHEGPWLLVARDELRGWVLEDEVARL